LQCGNGAASVPGRAFIGKSDTAAAAAVSNAGDVTEALLFLAEYTKARMFDCFYTHYFCRLTMNM
jgi:hypothetical protein